MPALCPLAAPSAAGLRDGAEARPHRRERQRLLLVLLAARSAHAARRRAAHHPALAGLWHDERLTDFAVSAEGVEYNPGILRYFCPLEIFRRIFENPGTGQARRLQEHVAGGVYQSSRFTLV